MSEPFVPLIPTMIALEDWTPDGETLFPFAAVLADFSAEEARGLSLIALFFTAFRLELEPLLNSCFPLLVFRFRPGRD